MPTTTMNATTSFVYLTDNLPKWIDQVKDLATHASKKHAEYVAEYNRRLASMRPKKQRTPSLDSCQVHEDGRLQPTPQILEPISGSSPETSTPNALPISPLEAGNKCLLVQAQRKRKLGSSIRSGVSAPQNFRSKHMVVIYYDTYLQEQLDTLVKSVGGARNNLRKGKLSRSASRGFELPCLRRATDHTSNGISQRNGYKQPPTSSVSLLTEAKTQLASPLATVDEAFTNADKQLEAAQNLCETAAHQVLRDGDCTVELTSVVTKLKRVLELAIATVTQLREEDAQQKEKERDQNQSKPDTITLAESLSPPSLIRCPTSKLVPSLSEKMDLAPIALLAASGGVAEIEVDDNSDQESIVVDITKFRTARMTRTQGLQT